MTRIVRTAYRYKRPTGKRKTVALEVPAIVPSPTTHGAGGPTRPAKAMAAPVKSAPANDDRRPAIKVASGDLEREPARTAYTKSAIVTARRPGKRYVHVPEMTEERTPASRTTVPMLCGASWCDAFARNHDQRRDPRRIR
jgi:hypothetical protein